VSKSQFEQGDWITALAKHGDLTPPGNTTPEPKSPLEITVEHRAYMKKARSVSGACLKSVHFSAFKLMLHPSGWIRRKEEDG
jgi:hypothetical protein